MSSKTNTKSPTKNFHKNTNSRHSVDFYPDCKTLLEGLFEYVNTGLASDANCLVIANQSHIQKLNRKLAENLDVIKAQRSGKYITLDAEQALKSFMINDLPDEKLFKTHIGGLVNEVITKKGRPLRAYSEMVSLLWKAGNKEAVLEVENLWNSLAENYDFSLYCAYPKLHFILDSEAAGEIKQCHNLHFRNFAS